MRTNNQKGMGLVMVLMLMAVLSILGVTILTISLSETKQVVHQDKRMQAYYLAKSGTDIVKGYILQNPDKARELLDTGKSDPNSQLGNGTFEVEVLSGDRPNEIKVKATGYAGDTQNTAVAVLRRSTAAELLDKVIYTNEDLDIQAMEVTGDIQSGGKITYGSNYKGNVQPNQRRTIALISPFPYPGAEDATVKKRVLDIRESKLYNNLTVENNGILNIITDGKVIEIAANNINIKGNVTIDASGGGLVKFYINNEMTITTTGLVNNKEPKSLFVYLKKDSLFELQANMVLNGYIIGPDATVKIQSSRSTINGAVFSNVVLKNAAGSGGHGRVYYQPLPSDDSIPVDAIEYKMVRWEK